MNISPYDAATQAATFLQSVSSAPSFAVVLGSGLGEFGRRLESSRQIPYEQIPYFQKSSVKGHAGQLVIGTIPGTTTKVAALCGRSHLYEGLPATEIVHPTRSMGLWGIKNILYTNAAGGIHPKLQPGDLMLLTDHMNFTGQNPLVGPIDKRLGSRFIDMTQAYDLHFQEIITQTAKQINIRLQKGIYLSLLGPSYETPAEIKGFTEMGASAIGMSTVLEVIAARQMNLKVAGISCITNFGAGISHENLSHDEVKETAQRVQEDFIKLLQTSIPALISSR